ncbi:MAG: NAD-dependent epimerase/dehydratase family protein [Planctomycetota bacterium]|jgi:nucleoside-diphosphate-sugar epimerase
MKVCIVGGTGNISTSIVRGLVEMGHEVVCFNRGRSGRLPEGVRLIEGDRADRESFEAAMQRERFDAAIDMICFNRDDALSDVRAFRDVSHFVQVSTVCTYGVDYDWLPVTEDHPLRPISDYGRNKVAADEAFMEARRRDGFPVTIVKPSTTYGPTMGLLRQIAWEFSWISRVVEGRPILICGDGLAIHQFLHVDDAAIAFAHMLGRPECIGQTYNLVRRGYTTWKNYHETAMSVLGRAVELIGISCRDLELLEVPAHEICRDIFQHNVYYSPEKLFADVPEFTPRISLADGIQHVYAAMHTEGRIPPSPQGGWEDQIIDRVQRLRAEPLG